MLIAHGMDSTITGLIQAGGASPVRSEVRLTRVIRTFRTRYPLRTTMSQNRMDDGDGCRIMLNARAGWPRSATMNMRHMTTAGAARNWPATVMRPNTLKLGG